MEHKFDDIAGDAEHLVAKAILLSRDGAPIMAEEAIEEALGKAFRGAQLAGDQYGGTFWKFYRKAFLELMAILEETREVKGEEQRQLLSIGQGIAKAIYWAAEVA